MSRKKRIFMGIIGVIVVIVVFFAKNLFYNTKSKVTKKDNKGQYEIYCGNGKMGDKQGNLLKSEFIFNYGLALNKNKEMLIVDSYNNKIKKVSNETITTIVGGSDKKDGFNLPLGEYVDGELKTVKFNKPRDLVLDNMDNIYISDSGNNVIRKIQNGRSYTFAGTGQEGYIDGKANKAKFNLPTGIAIDKEENIYVTDTLNHVIRRIDKNGNVSTFAGIKKEYGSYKDGDLKEAMFNEPSDIIIDKNGIMYVADSGNQKIRKIEKGKVTTIAGAEKEYIKGTAYIMGQLKDGKTSEAKFNFPKGLCLDDKENLYVADTFNHSIRVIKKDGKVYTLFGDGKPGSVKENRLNQPVSLVYNSGYLYVSDNKNNVVGRLKVN